MTKEHSNSAAAVALTLVVALGNSVCNAAPIQTAVERCNSLEDRMTGQFADGGTRIVSAALNEKGPLNLGSPAPGAPSVSIDAAEHCEVFGEAQARIGAGGQHYAIRFHLRLPLEWNGRFFFQGGGGSNGEIGNAVGNYSPAALPALLQGFAVVSQDSGHDNRLNNDAANGGALVFGFDEQARANYGHASLPIVAEAAKKIVERFYGSSIRYSYFVGCSKGGEEGLVLAERYSQEFDGIAAGAPAMSLPRAAVEEAWDTQQFAAGVSAAVSSDTSRISLAQLATAFSDADLALVSDAVLGACDADDGLSDGIVGDIAACSTTKIMPHLNAIHCGGEKIDGCLSTGQINSLTRLMSGAHDSHGQLLYSDWRWDAGLAAPGWRAWKLGQADGRSSSLNVILGGASLAAVFTTPPTAVTADPLQLLHFLLSFDFDRDAPKIYAVNSQFSNSAWDNISARSSDLQAFRTRRGKLIVTHGVSDPVFSINDTLAWWREVNQRSGKHAADFVRVFPVPGMNHCNGGPATDRFDVLSSLKSWVERSIAPSAIIAAANPAAPWPKRTRPLCAYPTVARYSGGDIDSAESFECRL